MSGLHAEGMDTYSYFTFFDRTASLFINKVSKDNQEISLWLQSLLPHLSLNSSFMDACLKNNLEEFDMMIYLLAFYDLGLDYFRIIIGAREKLDGWNGKDDSCRNIWEGLKRNACFKGIIDEYVKHYHTDSDISTFICHEIEKKRNMLVDQLTTLFDNNALKILFFLSGYGCSSDVFQHDINQWVAIDNLHDYVSGENYKLARAIIPAYIWIKNGMKPLRQAGMI